MQSILCSSNPHTSGSPAWNLPRRTLHDAWNLPRAPNRAKRHIQEPRQCSDGYKSIVGGDLASKGKHTKRSGVLLREAPVVRVEVPPRPLLVRVRRFHSDQPWTSPLIPQRRRATAGSAMLHCLHRNKGSTASSNVCSSQRSLNLLSDTYSRASSTK